MNKLIKVVGLLLLLIHIGCSNKEPLRLATYTYATNNRIANLEPLATLLESQLDRAVVIKSYPDVDSFIRGIKSNEVDIALINTLGYLLLSLDNSNMEVVATLEVTEGAKDNYKTALLTNSNNIQTLDDLLEEKENLSLSLVAAGSTSGNLVPRLMLSSLGIKSPEDQFESLSYGGNHTSTFQRLINREVDLCAIGSNEYFKSIENDPTLLESIRLLWMSREIPLGPVLLNRALSTKDQELITDILLQLHDNNKDVLQSIKEGWSEAKQADRYYPITDRYYDDFRMVNGNRTDLPDILELFNK